MDFGLPEWDEDDWPDGTWQDYRAPIIVDRGEGPHLIVGTYGMIPQKRLPPGVRITTMNARSETVGEKKSYRDAWNRSQLCLVPMRAFYEPCYETGFAEEWRIGLADQKQFAVAGLVRAWKDPDSKHIAYSFTQLTINADDHPFMKRMHKPNDEKRSLVIVPPDEYEAWLTCKDPEVAREFLKPYPAELMAGVSEGRYGKKVKGAEENESKLI
ncbi:SOS response-associated peptidase [Silvimonas soli]|uniref:SOS response-associated peptidase n=1 Tax=Silvimonas soli TaxID=2980100 RepID=UPI0024B38CE4|nr:SOS response-associated peptidase family protein [Silvimonas soli]